MTDDIKCSICGSKTTLRTSKKDGSKVHVCVNYPNCKGRVAYDDDWEDDASQSDRPRMKSHYVFCRECGNQISDNAAVCVKCGVPTGNAPMLVTSAAKSRVAYILLGIFLGQLGIHNFYAGYTSRAVTQLLISLLLCWTIVAPLAVWVWAVIEACTEQKDANGVKFSA